MVGACFVVALFTWGFAVFGGSVYLSQLTRLHGWPVWLVSSGITLFYVVNALSLSLVGGAIDRWGARPVMLGGAAALAAAVVGIAWVHAVWQLYAACVLLGLGYAGLSLTSISAALAPWFERHQGRSVAIALTGASFGAMLVVPLLVLGIDRFGFSAAVTAGGCLAACVLLPLVASVLRYRGPQALGLRPDGASEMPAGAIAAAGAAADVPASPPVRWSRAAAIRTSALWSTAIGFALGLVVQVGFLTHHINIAQALLGGAGAGWLVGGTGFANLLGRLLLARIVDRIDVRRYSALVFAAQAALLLLLAMVPTAPAMVAGSLLYGFCLGQITTLSPIVVRREFGAHAYGAIYGTAALVIQLCSAFGPACYGLLRDAFGSYTPVLAIAAIGEALAMATLLLGRPPRLPVA